MTSPTAMDICNHTYLLLNQKKYWWDSTGKRLRVKKMSVRYKRNVINFLDRKAEVLAAQYAIGELRYLPDFTMMGEHASDAYEDAYWQADRQRNHSPREWLRGTVLVGRLVDDVEYAEGILAEDGFDPWEFA